MIGFKINTLNPESASFGWLAEMLKSKISIGHNSLHSFL